MSHTTNYGVLQAAGYAQMSANQELLDSSLKGSNNNTPYAAK